MSDELAALGSLKRQLIDLAILIRNPRTPSGVRKRATRALCDLSIQALGTAEAMLKAQRQASSVKEHELV